MDNISRSYEQICVVGLGYIGLPTASLLATKGFKIHGVDTNAAIINKIQNGQLHIYEPDLDIIFKSAIGSGNLTVDLQPIAADIFIIAVPTPFKDNHVPDISYIEAAARAIAPYLVPGNLIILESTSPVQTTEKLADWLRTLRGDLEIPSKTTLLRDERGSDQRIFIAYCPERVLPGQIVKELIDNDRVIGGIDPASAQKAREFYRKFVNGNLFVTDARTAELCKLVENAFRDVNIALANELSIICDQLDINVWELIEMANRHPRVNILQPGPGVGGHCLAVDPWFIVDSAPENSKLIKTAREVNDHKPQFLVAKIKERAARFNQPRIACLGLSYKPNIDDLRESPALEITRRLAEEPDYKILVVEPQISSLPEELAVRPNVEFVDLNTAVQRADIVVLLVNHRTFEALEPDILNEKVLIDTRGMWRVLRKPH
jgi:UDP-N-acetyl-D-mannosaminuronic acid dehydrogenase